MQTVTESAKRTARKNAAKMAAQGYTFTPAKTAGFFWVVKPDGKDKYLVVALSGRCDCAYYEEQGVCKHAEYLREELDREQAQCAEWEAMQEARGELESLRF